MSEENPRYNARPPPPRQEMRQVHEEQKGGKMCGGASVS